VDSMHIIPSDVAFAPSVKAAQTRKGSRQAYARREEARSWQTTITSDLASFIAAQTSVFLATANPEGQPYMRAARFSARARPRSESSHPPASVRSLW
jgi:hypothetical protein